jgi:hypothetical protein
MLQVVVTGIEEEEEEELITERILRVRNLFLKAFVSL